MRCGEGRVCQVSWLKRFGSLPIKATGNRLKKSALLYNSSCRGLVNWLTLASYRNNGGGEGRQGVRDCEDVCVLEEVRVMALF